jgi:hypothetical protein
MNLVVFVVVANKYFVKRLKKEKEKVALLIKYQQL